MTYDWKKRRQRRREEDEEKEEKRRDKETAPSSKDSWKKEKNQVTRMGRLKGRLQKATKHISFCSFPIRKTPIAEQVNEWDEEIFSSALDLPYGWIQRNPSEVGQTCRGSVNLQEARILSDKATSSIVISASSQTFHVKAQSDADRQLWVNSLEYARHRAITRAESEEDEDAQIQAGETRAVSLNVSHQLLSSKLDDLHTAARLLTKQGEELLKSVHDEEIDKRVLAERAELLKITIAAVLKAAEEFVDLSEKGTRRLGKVVETEQKEKEMLQEQLETLAKQHSSLERAATIISKVPVSAYSDQDEDEFHDAAEELDRRMSTCSISSADTSTMIKATESVESTAANTITSSSCSNSNNVNNNLDSVSLSTSKSTPRKRRTTVPDRPDLPINLWSIMKNCIGKELSKIPMPVNFSEPLSMLQRVTEDLEYAKILEEAATKTSLEQMCYVASYAASNYSSACNRTNKPFNPLLGETYECDRLEDLGWRSITEQVSHHPPAAAHHAEGRGWTMYQDFTMSSRFRGKYLSIIPIGYTHVVFPKTEDHYSYKKVTTTVHNIIVGKLWIDNHGDMEITNHKTGDKCTLKFIPYSYFSRDTPRKVYGIVRDKTGAPRYVVQGTWDKTMDMMKVTSWSGSPEKPKMELGEPHRIWTVNPPIKNAEKMHNFTKLAIELNEEEDGVAPTDSRNRPDQRLMEIGRWDESNRKKQEIEEKQRQVRRKREAEMEKAMQRGERYEEYQPTWFVKEQDELNGSLLHKFRGDYWKCKASGDWQRCPTIF